MNALKPTAQFVAALIFAGNLIPLPASGLEDPGSISEKVGLDQKVGGRIDLNLPFTDSNGHKIRLKEIFNRKRPVILTPVFYKCPRLCGLVLDGVTSAINNLNLTLGADFKIVTVSFDPGEGPKLADKKARSYYAKLNNTFGKNTGTPEKGWSFLTGSPASINALMNQIGFHFKKDNGTFAHTAVAVILTPAGQIARYFPGVEFSPRDLRFSLIEASAGRLGSIVDAVLMYCFQFDPAAGRYTWAVFALLKVFGVISILGMGFLLLLLRKPSKKCHV